MADYYLGLMSGTSMDGIDIALVDFAKIRPDILAFKTYPYPSELLDSLHTLCSPSNDEIVLLGQVDRAVAMHCADAIRDLLTSCRLSARDINAIGSHGQTVRHHPQGQYGFTLQIGDPNTLSVLTGIKVVSDFRRKDIALGGQGAPLAPAFHQAVFRNSQKSRVILNIGGIANITYLSKQRSVPVIGFDTGPGNALMDVWCKRHLNQTYDKNGLWASTGKRDAELLKILLEEPYFARPSPKSTGRELFNMQWLESCLGQLSRTISAQSIQTTLVQLTACTIAQQIRKLNDVEQVYVCGGGAKNEFLMESLEHELVEVDVLTTTEIGIDPDAVEAVAFAWLAYAHQNSIPGNLPSVTGATRPAVLGGLYCPE